jgi:hypothetical protein
MTQLDVLYRYGNPPTEQVMLALSKARDVYGIRGLRVDEAVRTIRVEYDASRLSAAIVHQLLRRAGVDIRETVTLIPEPVPEEIAPPAPVQPSVAKAGL